VETGRQDFVIGLLIVSTIAVVIGALIATSGWGEHRYQIYMRAASAQGITVDTKVLVQGLEVGRVQSITPRVDSGTGRVSFLARLSLVEQFEKGAKLRLPLGTRADITPASQVTSAVEIRLAFPDSIRPGHPMLEAGDTISSTRRGSPLDAISEVASSLSRQVENVLQETHRTLARVQGTLAAVNTTVREISPDVQRTLTDVAGTMSRLNNVASRLDPGLADTVSATLATSNRLLNRLDSLARDVREMTVDNRSSLRETVTNLNQVSRQLNHFVEDISRRPYRLLTGVKPVREPRDSTKHSDPSPVTARDSLRP
jgi:ABC-type transporter Mla subunit MlaD